MQGLSPYHTVDAEEEGRDSEPESHASTLVRNVAYVIVVHGTEYMMVDETKHIHHLRREEGGGRERGREGRETEREREGKRKRGRERETEGEREREKEKEKERGRERQRGRGRGERK